MRGLGDDLRRSILPLAEGDLYPLQRGTFPIAPVEAVLLIPHPRNELSARSVARVALLATLPRAIGGDEERTHIVHASRSRRGHLSNRTETSATSRTPENLRCLLVRDLDPMLPVLIVTCRDDDR